MSSWQSGLYALPCGADFAKAFARGLLERMRHRPPQDMARVTIYANSGQSLLALRDALVWSGPLVLPQLRLIADIGGGAATAPLARRLELGRLIDAALRRQPADCLARGREFSWEAATDQFLAGLVDVPAEAAAAA